MSTYRAASWWRRARTNAALIALIAGTIVAAGIILGLVLLIMVVTW